MKYTVQQLEDIKREYDRPYNPELLGYESNPNIAEIEDSIKNIFKYKTRVSRKIDFLIHAIDALEYKLDARGGSSLYRGSIGLTADRRCTFICTLAQDFFKHSVMSMKKLYYNSYLVKGRNHFNIKCIAGDGSELDSYYDDTASILLFYRFLPEMLKYMPRWLNPDNHSWFDDDETRAAVLHEILNTILDEEINKNTK